MAGQHLDGAMQLPGTAAWLHQEPASWLDEPAPKAMLERMQDVTQKKHFEDPVKLELAAAKTLAVEYGFFCDVSGRIPGKLPTFNALKRRFRDEGYLLGLACPRLAMWEARKAWNFMMEALAARDRYEQQLPGWEPREEFPLHL